MSARALPAIPALPNVLFATDLSPGSLLAFPFAASIAHHYHGKIFLAHITSSEDYAPVQGTARTTLNRLQMGVEEGIVAALGGLQDIPHEVLLDHGDVRSSLMTVADRCRIDLIAIGTHGWRGIKKLLRGSTAEEIACMAARPVMTVGPHVSSEWDFRHILYETDFSPESARAMPFAFSLAEAYDASLLCLHVNELGSKEPPVLAGQKTQEFFNKHVCRDTCGDLVEKCSAAVEFGSRTQCILDVANGRSIDLIVMGLHASRGIKARVSAHLPGSTAYDVTAEARCPVITVPLASKTEFLNEYSPEFD
jgi:nucleotide-binding universal stress UspA family protein